jgi:hypothetical protein
MQNNILYIFLIIILLISVVLLIVFQVKDYTQFSSSYSGGKKHKKYGGAGTCEQLLDEYFTAVGDRDVDKFIKTASSGWFIEEEPYIAFSNDDSINDCIVMIWERYLHSEDIRNYITSDMVNSEGDIVITSFTQLRHLNGLHFIEFLKKELGEELTNKEIESKNIVFINYIVRKLYEYILSTHYRGKTYDSILNRYLLSKAGTIDKFIKTLINGYFIKDYPYIQFSEDDNNYNYFLYFWWRYLTSENMLNDNTIFSIDEFFIENETQFKELKIYFLQFLKIEIETKLQSKLKPEIYSYIIYQLYNYISDAHGLLQESSTNYDEILGDGAKIPVEELLPAPKMKSASIIKDKRQDAARNIDLVKGENEDIDEEELESKYTKQEKEAKEKSDQVKLEQEIQRKFDLEKQEKRRQLVLDQEEALKKEEERFSKLTLDEKQAELAGKSNNNTSSATLDTSSTTLDTSSAIPDTTGIIKFTDLMLSYSSIRDIHTLMNSLYRVNSHDLADYLEFLIPQIVNNNPEISLATIQHTYDNILSSKDPKGLFTVEYNKYSAEKSKNLIDTHKKQLSDIYDKQLIVLYKIVGIIDKYHILKNNKQSILNRISNAENKRDRVPTSILNKDALLKQIKENHDKLVESKKEYAYYEEEVKKLPIDGKKSLDNIEKPINNKESEKLNQEIEKLKMEKNKELEKLNKELEKLKMEKNKEIERLKTEKIESSRVNNADDLTFSQSNYDQLKSFSRLIIVANANMIPKNSDELFLIPQRKGLIPDTNKQNNERLQFSQIKDPTNLPSGTYYSRRLNKPVIL